MTGIILVGPLIIVVIVVIVVAVWAVARYQRRTEAIVREVDAAQIEALRYRVPTGQDPAAVVAALTREGYTAIRETRSGDADILVECPGGADRERARVRAVIKHAADKDMQGTGMPEHEVRFVDEEQPR